MWRIFFGRFQGLPHVSASHRWRVADRRRGRTQLLATFVIGPAAATQYPVTQNVDLFRRGHRFAS
jgi:hypothetical protein